MPANLTPQYREAEEAYRRAATDEEKLACLERMLAVIPKHKGTDKMQADLKRRIAQLRRAAGGSRAKRRASGQLVEKQGAGQATLLGPPNAGKSALLAALTHAPAHVAAYPFTTQRAQPGMMAFEDVQIQLVDLPAVAADFMPAWLPDMVRRADLAILVADLGADDVLDGLTAIVERLAAVRIALCGVAPPQARGSDDPTAYRRTIVLANKSDLPGAADRLEVLNDLLGQAYPILAVSAATGQGLDAIPRAVFDALGVIRVYSKAPGKPPDMKDPFILPRGVAVYDFALKIHKELAERLSRARVWGHSKYEGQSVRRDHVLCDRDVVELHE